MLGSDGTGDDFPLGFQIRHDLEGFTVTPPLGPSDDETAVAVLNRALEQRKLDQIMNSVRSDVLAFAAVREQISRAQSDDLEQAIQDAENSSPATTPSPTETEGVEPKPLSKRKKSVSFSKTVSIFGWRNKGGNSRKSMLKQFHRCHSSEEIFATHGNWCKFWALKAQKKEQEATSPTQSPTPSPAKTEPQEPSPQTQGQNEASLPKTEPLEPLAQTKEQDEASLSRIEQPGLASDGTQNRQ
eukprot:g58442.t1